MRSPSRAIVVGGGVSGIAAALALAEAGREVTLLERRRFLGGRAYSFSAPGNDDEIDNGQHILLRCCTNALDLLDQLSVSHLIDWYDRFHYLEPGAAADAAVLKRHDLAPSPLPAPFHFLPGIARWTALTGGERFSVMRAFAAMMFSGEKRRATIARGPFASWLASRNQSERVRRRFWAPIVEGAVNETLDRVVAGPCLQVFLEGFLAHREAAQMGVPRPGLTRMLEPGTRRALEASGGRVLTQSKVTALDWEVGSGRINAIKLADGQRIEAEEFVFALPPQALRPFTDIEPKLLIEPRLLSEFETSSITGIHLWLDRQVTDLPHAALLESPMHWFFAKPTAHPRARQRLALVVSASRNLESRGQDEILALAEKELRRFLPEMRGARVVQGLVVKEPRATFSATPGIEALRPGPRTGLVNVTLAGDWIQSGWPSTIEGSIRAGRMAAGRLSGRNHLVPDLAPGPLARLLIR
jgi:squalene-associated FAD-dependent desaturase